MRFAPRSEAEFLEQQALAARAGMGTALIDLRCGLRELVDPPLLLRRQPIAGCVFVGVVAFATTAAVTSHRARRHARTLLTGSVRALREAVLGALLSRWVWRALGPPEAGPPRLEQPDCPSQT